MVKEPPQPQKIKLRVPSQPQATPPATGPPKKITIVHGVGTATATASPAPPNAGVEGAVNGIPPQRTVMPGPNGVVVPSGLSMTPGHPGQRDSMSAPMPSASPALGRFRLELANGQTPGYMPRPNGMPPQPMPIANGLPPQVHQAQVQYHQQVAPIQNVYQPPPPEPRPQPIYQSVYRAPGKGNVASSSNHTPMLTV